MSPRAHRFWVNTHLWIGLTLGLVLTLVSISGSILAISGPLLKWELGSMLFPAGVDTDEIRRTPAIDLPVDRWIAAAKVDYPELHRVEVVATPRSVPFPADVVMLAGPLDPALADGEERHVVVSLDPASGRLIDRAILEDTLVGNVLSFHATLMGGPVGFFVVAVTGFVALLSLATGLYLWWPRKGAWRSAFRYRRAASGRAWLLSLHSVSAAWLFVPLAVAIISGSYILTPQPYDSAFGLVSDIRKFEGLAARDRASCIDRVDEAAAIRIASQVHPGLSLRLLTKPEDPCYPYIVGLTTPERHATRALYTEVWVDRATGRVEQSRRGDQLSAAEALKSWMGPIHTNFAGGTPGTVLMFLTGLLVPLLYFTGLLAWVRQQKTRRIARLRQASGGVPG